MKVRYQKIVRMDAYTAGALEDLAQFTDRSQEGVIRWLINTAGQALEQNLPRPKVQDERKIEDGSS
jgi:hypothetical protein